MSRLQVLSFPDQKSAEGALRKAELIGETGPVAVLGAALLERDESGEVKVVRAARPSEKLDAAPAASAIFGLFLGVFVGAPVAGFAVGGAVGLAFQKLRNSKGEPDADYIASRLQPGTWLLVMQLDVTEEHALNLALEQLGGEDPVAAELSDEDERVILDAIHGTKD
jgi:uncharacterized membrane protein